ncbi:uncharacterized protein PV09_05564 [Verruconis gallopava]|uniref:Peroxidase n=1 Tax=Verruconis gallopava TaxID=253628 RepID=A0A0D1XLQ8_9PEZI|nr:uncharacterized protein PV09_05564 [Verruconis gallopava]KIW03356.1 hypothetical protein PV09_05564 [Verruconis gallopava]
MKFSIVALGASLSTTALAFPGMTGGSDDMMNFHKSLIKRAQLGGPHMRRDGTPDLPALNNVTSTGTGQQIKDCLYGTISCEAAPQKTYVAPALGSKECDSDKCCIWDYVVKDLVTMFTLPNGQCSELARQAIRLGFHDAGAWSINSGFGGADGSMLISDEVSRPENKGLESIVASGKSLLAKWNVSAADLVQLMANVATVICPLGPRVLTFIGRPDSADSPTDLLPGPFSDATTLINLFQDKTISSDELVALVGAHSTSHQDFVDPSNAGSFQDTTPGVWDTLFYSETANNAFSVSDVTKFPSDIALSKDARTSGVWGAMTNQRTWNAACTSYLSICF